MPIRANPTIAKFTIPSAQYLLDNPGASDMIAMALDDIETCLTYRQYDMVTLGRGKDLRSPQLSIRMGLKNWVNFEGSCLAECLVAYYAEAVATPAPEPPPPPLK